MILPMKTYKNDCLKLNYHRNCCKGGQITQWVKGLLCSHKDLSSDTYYLCKSHARQQASGIPVLGTETVASLRLTDWKPSWNGLVQWRTLSQKSTVESDVGGSWRSSSCLLLPAEVSVPIPSCVHMCVHHTRWGDNPMPTVKVKELSFCVHTSSNFSVIILVLDTLDLPCCHC